MKNKVFLLSLFTILLASCSKEEVANYYVDPALEPYFDLFAEAGTSRGVDVDFEAAEIETAFVNLEDSVPGQCAHSEASPNLLRVDPEIWETYEEWEREFLIFHELGHCFLGRSHDDSKNSEGICQSIMHSSSKVCDNNYVEDREILLDELFK